MRRHQIFNDILGTIKGFNRQISTTNQSIMNNAVMFQRIAGTDCAATFLKNYGVNIDVALRVLARYPVRRR